MLICQWDVYQILLVDSLPSIPQRNVGDRNTEKLLNFLNWFQEQIRSHKGWADLDFQRIIHRWCWVTPVLPHHTGTLRSGLFPDDRIKGGYSWDVILYDMLRTGNTNLCRTKHHEVTEKLLRHAEPLLLSQRQSWDQPVLWTAACVTGCMWVICRDVWRVSQGPQI